MLTLLKLFAGHLIGDFFLQPDCIAKKKGDSLVSLSVHSLINALSVYIILGEFTLWWILPVVFVTHFIIDYAKSHWTSDNVKWFLVDQAMHISVLGIIWALISGDVSAMLSNGIALVNSESVWEYLIVYGMMTMPVSLLIEKIFKQWAMNVPDYKGLPGAGKWIGYIERILIVTFIVTHNFSAVGFLITAKSVFRFSDIKSSADFRLTEYVLLGTLFSFAIAIIAGLMLA